MQVVSPTEDAGDGYLEHHAVHGACAELLGVPEVAVPLPRVARQYIVIIFRVSEFIPRRFHFDHL